MGNSTNISVGNNLVPAVELIGDWDKVQSLLSQLPLAVKIGSKAGQLSAAEKIKDLVRKNIRNRGPEGVHWNRYSMRYEARKIRLGGDVSKFYRLTDTYYSNIKVINSNSGKIMVGLPRGIKGRVNSKPIDIGTIARILEHGSEAHNITARPLWAPTLKQFGGKKRVAYHIVYHIRSTVYAMTGLRAKVNI